MDERACKNSACNKPFVPNRSDAQYCSNTCKTKHFRDVVKATGISPASAAKPLAIAPMKQDLKIPNGLAPDANFIVTELTRQRDKLEKTVEEQAKEIKDLTKEKTALEKERDSAIAEVNAKPSALQGFLGDPSKIIEVAQNLPGIFAGAAEMIRAAKTPATQIAGLPENTGTISHPVVEWLGKQPPEVQNSFNDMIENFKKLPATSLLDMIAYTNRNAMGVKRRAV